jgi:hypothetical protein
MRLSQAKPSNLGVELAPAYIHHRLSDFPNKPYSGGDRLATIANKLACVT